MTPDALDSVLIGAIGVALLELVRWFFTRKRVRADVAKIAGETASELLVQMRIDLTDARERANAANERIEQVEEKHDQERAEWQVQRAEMVDHFRDLHQHIERALPPPPPPAPGWLQQLIHGRN